MSLSKEEIVKNVKTFFKTGEKYEFVNEKFTEEIGEHLMHAPCTMDEKGYNSFEGGLLDHITNMTSHALKVNEMLPEDKRVAKEPLIKVCLLHQIGKAKMFVENDSDWHKKRGMNYTWNDGELALTVSELSLKYIWKYGLNISEDEYDAIALYGSEFTNRPFTHIGVRIAAIVKAANLIAMSQEK